MIQKFILSITLSILCLAQTPNQSEQSPYKLFWQTLKVPHLSKKLLIRPHERVIKCGKERQYFYRKLKEQGLYKIHTEFYTRYKHIFDIENRKYIDKFANTNDTTILWTVSNRGGFPKSITDINQTISDELLNNNIYMTITTEVLSLSSLSIEVNILYPHKDKSYNIIYYLEKSNTIWSIKRTNI